MFLGGTDLDAHATYTAARIAASRLWMRFSAIETLPSRRALGAKFYVVPVKESIDAECPL